MALNENNQRPRRTPDKTAYKLKNRNINTRNTPPDGVSANGSDSNNNKKSWKTFDPPKLLDKPHANKKWWTNLN